MSESIRIKRSTFRKGIIILYAFFLSLIAYTFAPQLLTPKPGEQSLRCAASHWYVGLARAAGQNCKTKCTNWEAADCSGYSSCYNKNVSCNNGVDQDGRPCKGCCYDCVVVCEPDPDKPPSISGSVSCGQWGKNGWCINSAVLNLDASDPQGYDLSITGDAQGASISCNGNCSINLPVGSGVANYVVTASQSGLSASGGASWDFDPESPDVNLNISGSTGQNGWYKSPVTVTSTGSDSISGLAGAFLSVDNGTWQTSATLGDGKHNVDITAADYAGNIVNSSTTLSIDTTTPSISVSVKGKAGKSKWFASETTVSASASDSTSGIASIEVSVDGSSYQSYSSAITFPKGSHTIQFRATDRAGNSTETPSQSILIDRNNPTVSIDVTDFLNGTIAFKAHDEESGVSFIYITIEDKEGKYPKVKWNKSVSGKNVTDVYHWSEKSDDGIVAPPGEYSVWIKVVDQAGNEDTQVGSMVVPEPDSSLTSSIFGMFQEDPSTSSSDASEPGETNDADTPSDLTYGGEITEPTDIMNQSLSVSANASSTSTNPFPWELILGATTIAAGTTAYVATKSKKSKAQKRETRARLMAELEAKWEAEALAKAAATKASKMKMQSLKTERFDAKDEVEWERAEAAHQKALKKAKKEAETKAGLEAYYNARKQGEQEAAASVPPKEKSWWEKASSFVQEKVVQPVISTLNEGIYKPYIHPFITPKKIATTILATVLGVQGIQWVNTLIKDPELFLDVKKQSEVLIEQLRAKHPPTPENLTWSYVSEHPYDVFSTGIDVVNTFTNIVASYADTVWQHNPLVEFQNNVLESLENAICTKIKNLSWSNRCTAGFYLASGINSTPFDTTLGILDSFVVNPIAGLIKQEALVVESLEAIPELLNTTWHEGWQGGVDFAKGMLNKNVQTVLNDKQIRSALFFESLILLGLLALPIAGVVISGSAIAGGIILGTTVNGLIELDTAITNTKNKKSLIELITSHETRTTVVGSILVLSMMGIGLEHKFSEFKTFQDNLPPSAQSTFQNLSLIEQTRLADLATKLKISPGAIEFYLAESTRLGSPLAELSIIDGLKVSELKTLPETSAIKYIYDARAGQYRDLSTGRFVSPRNLPWPENSGFAKTPTNTTLLEGTIIDRYGKLIGQYAGEPGTSISARGLAMGYEDLPYTRLRVLKPITVPSGPAAPVPEFGAVGGATQYYFKNGIQFWIDSGYLEVLP